MKQATIRSPFSGEELGRLKCALLTTQTGAMSRQTEAMSRQTEAVSRKIEAVSRKIATMHHHTYVVRRGTASARLTQAVIQLFLVLCMITQLL